MSEVIHDPRWTMSRQTGQIPHTPDRTRDSLPYHEKSRRLLSEKRRKQLRRFALALMAALLTSAFYDHLTWQLLAASSTLVALGVIIGISGTLRTRVLFAFTIFFLGSAFQGFRDTPSFVTFTDFYRLVLLSLIALVVSTSVSELSPRGAGSDTAVGLVALAITTAGFVPIMQSTSREGQMKVNVYSTYRDGLPDRSVSNFYVTYKDRSGQSVKTVTNSGSILVPSEYPKQFRLLSLTAWVDTKNKDSCPRTTSLDSITQPTVYSFEDSILAAKDILSLGTTRDSPATFSTTIDARRCPGTFDAK